MLNNQIRKIEVKGIDRNYELSFHSSKTRQKYLSINVKKGNLSKEIIIIEDDFDDFLKAINEITEYKAYNVDEIRQKHEKAYTKWTKEDDEKLEKLFCEKKSAKEIAEIFGRQQNAIRARIKKLELKQKYE